MKLQRSLLRNLHSILCTHKDGNPTKAKDERTFKCFAVELGSKGLLLNSFYFIFFSRSYEVLFLDAERDGEIFFNTQFKFTTKGHVSLRDGRRPKIFKIQNDKHFCTPADPVPPKVIRRKTHRLAGKILRTHL